MIKFNRYNVTDGKTKVRCSYSAQVHTKTGGKCVTIYAKDYGAGLGRLFPNVQNNTDSQVDYFEKDRVRIFEGDALYPAALARVQANEKAWADHQAKLTAKREARRQAARAFAAVSAGTIH